jgi:hypothetical protein
VVETVLGSAAVEGAVVVEVAPSRSPADAGALAPRIKPRAAINALG